MRNNAAQGIAASAIVSLAACTAAVLPPVASPPAESRLVMVVGERADALGWTTSSAEQGMVRVRMHDGRDLVVREQAVAAPWLEVGRWVLRRTGNGLEPAEIVSGLDAFLEVRPRGQAAIIVPIGEVFGILHERPPEADRSQEPTQGPAPEGPVPPPEPPAPEPPAPEEPVPETSVGQAASAEPTSAEPGSVPATTSP
ncbi:MAG: hypothetical protein ACK6CU_19965 [Deltaproteobacteria bacterium]